MSITLHQLALIVAAATVGILLGTGWGRCIKSIADIRRVADDSSTFVNYEQWRDDYQEAGGQHASWPESSSRATFSEYRRGHRSRFNFMVPLYRDPHKDKLAASGDGYLTGFGLLVRNLTMIVHNQVLERASRVEGTQLKLKGWGSGWEDKGANFLPGSIWANHSEWNEWDGGYYPRLMANLGANVSLVYLDQKIRPGHSEDKRARDRFSSGFSIPELNSNVSLKENCYIYAFGLRGYTRNNERCFTRWPVKVVTCEGNICKMTRGRGARVGAICQTWHDVGAPIMCSSVLPSSPDPDGTLLEGSYLKLSYMVVSPLELWPDDEEMTCFARFYALRLADYYPSMMEALTLGPPGQTSWPSGR